MYKIIDSLLQKYRLMSYIALAQAYFFQLIYLSDSSFGDPNPAFG